MLKEKWGEGSIKLLHYNHYTVLEDKPQFVGIFQTFCAEKKCKKRENISAVWASAQSKYFARDHCASSKIVIKTGVLFFGSKRDCMTHI